MSIPQLGPASQPPQRRSVDDRPLIPLDVHKTPRRIHACCVSALLAATALPEEPAWLRTAGAVAVYAALALKRWEGGAAATS